MGGRVAIALCVLLAGACTRAEPPTDARPEPEAAAAPPDLAGHACVGSWSGPPVLYLKLEIDGRYEALLIPSGAGSTGYCLTVVGNGSSRGTWRAEGVGARLEAEREDEDLAMSLRGATLERDGEGLVLVLGEQRLSLRSSDF